MEKLSKDELWAIYETLPNDLKDAIFSEDTADAIWNICKLYDVEKVPETAKLVGKVLMGLLPPESFITALQDELELSSDTAKKVGMEIEHFIFNLVKDDLDLLYKKEGAATPKEEKKEPEPPKKEDTYREPVE
jgi:hypothetical protein